MEFTPGLQNRGSKGPLDTIRLLVVEDNSPYLYLIERAFHDRQGQIRWELTVAKDGEQALHLLFEEEDKASPCPTSFFWIGICRR